MLTGSWDFRGQHTSDLQDVENETAPAGDSLFTTEFVKGKFKAPPSPFVSRKTYVQTTKLQVCSITYLNLISLLKMLFVKKFQLTNIR